MKLDVTVDVATIVKWLVLLAIALIAGISPSLPLACGPLASSFNAKEGAP